MKRSLLFVFLCLVVLLTGCGRVKRKLSGSSSPKPPPMHPFYTYTGFRDWYRFPLKYPYQISTIDQLREGYLEEHTGGDIAAGSKSMQGIDVGGRITHLHPLEDFAVFRKEDGTFGYLEYATGKTTLLPTEAELKQACLLTPGEFKPIEYYYNQFSKGKLIYPPNASSEKIRTDLIAQFHGMTVKMHPYGKERGNAKIEVTCGESEKDIDVQTGKAVFVWKWSLPQEKQDMLDKWLSAHRAELLEMWETRTVKLLPAPEKEANPAK